jgi:hypothetical protein
MDGYTVDVAAAVHQIDVLRYIGGISPGAPTHLQGVGYRLLMACFDHPHLELAKPPKPAESTHGSRASGTQMLFGIKRLRRRPNRQDTSALERRYHRSRTTGVLSLRSAGSVLDDPSTFGRARYDRRTAIPCHRVGADSAGHGEGCRTPVARAGLVLEALSLTCFTCRRALPSPPGNSANPMQRRVARISLLHTRAAADPDRSRHVDTSPSTGAPGWTAPWGCVDTGEGMRGHWERTRVCGGTP